VSINTPKTFYEIDPMLSITKHFKAVINSIMQFFVTEFNFLPAQSNSLLFYGINYDRNLFYSTGPRLQGVELKLS
jgi:hypothetical protein